MPRNGRLPPPTSSPPQDPLEPPAKKQRTRNALVRWTEAEDATIMRLRSTVPPARWSAVASAVNLLTPGGNGRTTTSVRLRHFNVLRFKDQPGGGSPPEPLNAHERQLLGCAVKDVECMADKWWFVSARYAELRKAGNREAETRELGKLACKRWCSILKDEQTKVKDGQSKVNDEQGKGKDEQGKGKDEQGKDEQGKDEQGKDEQGKDE